MSTRMDESAKEFATEITFSDVGSKELKSILDEGFISPSSKSDPKEVVPIEEEDENPTKENKTVNKSASGDELKQEEPEDKAVKKFESLLFGFGEEDEEEEDTSSDNNKVPSFPEKSQKNQIRKKEEPVSKEKEEEFSEEEDNTFTVLSKELLKAGVFSAADEKEKEEIASISTPEQFLERFIEEKKRGAGEILSEFLSQYGDDYKKAFEAIYIKGVHPSEYFGKMQDLERVANLDMEKPENQEKVIYKALEQQGFEKEDIEEEITRLKNYGDIESTAKRYHKVLLKKEAQELEELERKSQERIEALKRQKQSFQDNVHKLLENKLKEKNFDGIPLNNNIANEVAEFILVDKYKTPSGELLTEFDKFIIDLNLPENHEKKVKVALLLKILEKDPSLSVIKTRGVSEKSSQLFEELKRKNSISSGTFSGNKKPKMPSFF